MEAAHSETIPGILVSLGKIVDDLKAALFSGDRRMVRAAEREFESCLKASAASADVTQALQRLGMALQDFIKGVRTKVETETPFTQEGLLEVGELMALARNIARDTRDLLAARNAGLSEYLGRSAQFINGRVSECCAKHQERLFAGACSPKASFLYLDIVLSLKRIAQEVARLSEKPR
jgi:Na+/phosphate symporter